MKKGCFITFITLFTIIVAAGLFLYKKYWPEIKEVGKEKVLEIAVNDMEKKIDQIQKSKYRDSLKFFIRESINDFKKSEFDTAIHKFGDLVDQTNYFIKDNIIDSLEFTALKNMARKYERSAKN